MRIGVFAPHPERELEVCRSHIHNTRLLLNGQLVVEHLFEQQFPYLAIDAPDARIERRHRALVLGEDFIGDFAKFAPKLDPVKVGEPLTAMTLEETTKRLVQKASRVERGQIKRRFAARL